MLINFHKNVTVMNIHIDIIAPNFTSFYCWICKKFKTRWTMSYCSLMIPPLFGKHEVGIWQVKKHLPWYGVPIWSLWPHIRFLPSIVAEKNLTKNVHICMFNAYKNQQSRQRGSRILMVPKTLPTIWYTYMTLVTKYQISAINSYWEKCDEKYLGRTDRRTEVRQYTPSPFGEWEYNYFGYYIIIKDIIVLLYWTKQLDILWTCTSAPNF